MSSHTCHHCTAPATHGYREIPHSLHCDQCHLIYLSHGSADDVLQAMREEHDPETLLRLAALDGVQRRHQVWERAYLRRLAILSGRPSFVGPSTGSPRHDFCVVEIVHEETAKAVEWWG